ncbi:MAG: hypothetical protein U0Q07_07915 [Acidimicrobiales bacterium]
MASGAGAADDAGGAVPAGPDADRRAGRSDGADAWLAATRADEAARVRARRSSLARQRAEEATLLGAIADLAERQDLASVALTGGRRLAGWIEWVGTDALLVASAAGPRTLVPARAVVSVSAADRSLPPSPRPAVGATDLHGLLSGLAGDGVRVAARAGAVHESGDLAHVGVDVVTLRRDDRTVVHLALGAIDELTLLDDPWTGPETG